MKKLGCCTVCDEPIFDVVSRHVGGLYDGEIKQVGLPLPGARRAHLLRVSGRQTYWSLCSSCEVGPGNIVKIHKKEIASMVRERDAALASDNPRQAEYRGMMLKLFCFDVPIGVLGIVPWTEVR